MLRRNHPSLSLHSYLPHGDTSSSSEDDDEEEGLRREEIEEAEQERLLSREYGEATKRRTTSRKRSHQQTDAEIIDALNSKSSNATTNHDGTTTTASNNNDEEALKAKRTKRRIVLNESKLTSSKGLISVRKGFPMFIRFKEPKKLSMKDMTHTASTSSSLSSSEQRRALKRKQFELDIRSSATYISKLMNAYHDFAMDIAPNMHPKDTFRKIESLASKKQVRDYLDTMREEVCKEHLKEMYGHDRAERLVNELEDGLKAHQEKILDGGGDENGSALGDDLGKGGARTNVTNGGDARSSGSSMKMSNYSGIAMVTNNLRATRNVGILVEDDEQDEHESNKQEKKVDGTNNLNSSPIKEKTGKFAKVDARTMDGNINEDEENEVMVDDDIVGDTDKGRTKNVEEYENEEDSVEKDVDNEGNKVSSDRNEAEPSNRLQSYQGSSNDEANKDESKVNEHDETEEVNLVEYKSTFNEEELSKTTVEKDQVDGKEVEGNSSRSVQNNSVASEGKKVDKLDTTGDKINSPMYEAVAGNVVQSHQETSIIVESPPPTQDMDNQEDLVIDASQSISEKKSDVPTMTQNTLSQFEDTQMDDFFLNSTQPNDQNQAQDFDETQTVIQTMTPTDFISQEY